MKHSNNLNHSEKKFLSNGRLRNSILVSGLIMSLLLVISPQMARAIDQFEVAESTTLVRSDAFQAVPAANKHKLGNDHTLGGNFTDLHNPGLMVNEVDTYLNKGAAPLTIQIDTFNFYVTRIGNPVTPFIVKVLGDNNFDVIAVGKTRTKDDYAMGVNTFPFDDTVRTVTVAPGEKIATGFYDSFPDGTGWGLGDGNPIPAEQSGQLGTGTVASHLDQDELFAFLPEALIEIDDGFIADAKVPVLVEGQNLLTANASRDVEVHHLLRNYRYSIEFSSNNAYAFKGATVYTEQGLAGTPQIFSDGIYWLGDTTIGSGQASSIEVEQGYVAYLCDGTLENPETCKVYTPGEYGFLLGFNNSATILKVDQNDPGRHGLWENVYELPQRAIAAAQMPDGRVMFWQGGSPTGPGKEILIVDPANPESTVQSTGAPNDHDTFCPGPALLPNGDLILAGGGRGSIDPENGEVYEDASSVFKWDQMTWIREEDMAEPHYYGTSLMLADGKVFHALGSAVAANDYTQNQPNNPEIWNGTSWEKLTGLDLTPLHADHGFYNSNYYPYLHLMPNSNVFHSGGVPNMHEINPNTQKIYNQGVRATTDGYRHWGNAIMIDEGILFVSGGRSDKPESNRTTVLIDLNDELDIKSEFKADMKYDRAFHNMVQLPTGDVFVSGGNSSGKIFIDHGTVYPTELWDRETNTWSEMAELTTPRNYHSTSLLMPDGRIWQAGGDCGHCTTGADPSGFNHHYNLQFYSPPYLFNPDGTEALRPEIVSYPTGVNAVKASSTFEVTVTGAGSDQIVDFNIIKLSSTTHQINSDVRRLSLDFTSLGSGKYEIETHDNINVMTPGYWMLFAVNANGVPAVAPIIHISTEPGTLNPTPKPKPIKIPIGNTLAQLRGIDDWKSNLIINKTDIYTNNESVNETLEVSEFSYYAGDTGGPVTPFVVKVNGGVDNYTVIAIGDMRVPTQLGVNVHPFVDDGPKYINLAPGETIAIGYIDARPDGQSGPEDKAIITRDLVDGKDDIFYVGNAGGKIAELVEGQAPILFEQPRDVGKRDYAYTILFIKQENEAPVVTPVGNQASPVDTPLNLQIQATDDGLVASYEVSLLPDGLSIDTTSGLISGTPTAAGNYFVEVIVTDNLFLSSSIEFSWSVTDGSSANQLPTITNLSNQNHTLADAVDVQVNATDPDNETLSYFATGLPTGLVINGTTGKITGTPTKIGTFEVILNATDPAGAKAVTSLIWTIEEAPPPPNDSPELTAPENQTGEVGQQISLAVVATDPDEDPLTYSAEGLPPGLEIDAETGLISGVLAQAGTYLVSVTVEDDKSASDTAAFDWQVDLSALNVYLLGNPSLPMTKKDDWKSNIVINEGDVYTNNFNVPTVVQLSEFRFYAGQANAPVTPFIVKVNGDNDFTVLKVGTTRTASAVGPQTFPFSDNGTITINVAPSDKLATGFIDSLANGTTPNNNFESVIPFSDGGGGHDEVWYIGQTTGNVGSVTAGLPPQSTNTPVTTFTRSYAFAVLMVEQNPTPTAGLNNKIYLPFVIR